VRKRKSGSEEEQKRRNEEEKRIRKSFRGIRVNQCNQWTKKLGALVRHLLVEKFLKRGRAARGF
jgi:hypothetical protein